jgi:hypothetical protein
MNFGAGEGIAGGDMGEPDQCLHERQLARMVDLQPGDPLATGPHRRLAELAQQTTVHEGFQDVLLDIEITIDDRLQRRAQLGQILYSLWIL